MLINASTRFISSVQFLSVVPHMSVIGLLVGLQLISHFHERPGELDLSAWIMEVEQEPPSIFGGALPEEQFESVELAVLALDGLGREVLIPLLKRGDCPNFNLLLEGAATGHLATNFYSRSPALWESIATGMDPFGHGVSDHNHWKFPGIDKRIGHLPRVPLSNSAMGINRLLAATRAFAPWTMVFSSAVDARAARFWEIAERAGHTSGVYG